MKKIYLITAFMTMFGLSKAQQQCVDFGDIPSDLNSIINYPSGTAFYETGDIKLKKTSGPLWDVFWPSSDRLDFNGYLHIDVSSNTCENKILTLSTINIYMIAVDNDTTDFSVLASAVVYPIVGSNYSIDTISSGVFEITGDFNEVILGRTSCSINEICLATEGCSNVATKETKQQNISFYPNPTSGIVSFDAIYDVVDVYNVLGELVLSKSKPGSTVNLESLSPGQYYIKPSLGDQTYTKRVIKK